MFNWLFKKTPLKEKYHDLIMKLKLPQEVLGEIVNGNGDYGGIECCGKYCLQIEFYSKCCDKCSALATGRRVVKVCSICEKIHYNTSLNC